MLHINLQSVAIIMYYKSPDKAVLEPSLILYMQVTQPMSNIFYSMFLHVFIAA